MAKHTGKGKTARMMRRIAATVCLVALTLFLVSAAGSAALYFRWIERLQIMPLALASAFMTLLFWLVFTFVFGRIYCSVICPMGALMDIFARLPRLGRHRLIKRPYHYCTANNNLRYSWLALIIVTMSLGSTVVITLFDPYSAYSTIISNAFELLTDGKMIIGTLSGIAVAGVTLAVVATVAALSGRTICNSFCPVGAALSIPARYSLYGIDINTDLCIGCNRCVDVCKAHCINPSAHSVDTSRCIICFNCLDSCQTGAISYTSRRHRLSTPLMMPKAKTSASIDAPQK